MLNQLILFALRNRNWVLAATFILIVFGIVGIKHLPIDAVPDITNIQVTVNSKTGALDPEKIEMLVTRPIEIEMGGLPHLEEIRSISKYGLSQVTLVFQDGTDPYWARQQVMERIQNTRKTIPLSITPELAPITTGLGEVFMYSVEADPKSQIGQLPEIQRLTELRTVQDFVIRPALKRIAGVADIDSNGGYQKEIHVNFFPNLLDKVGLTIEQLTTRLETLGENYGGGYIQREGNQVIVRTVPGIARFQDLSNIPLGLDVRGRPIRLKEFADIREEHSLRVGAATRNGQETVLGTVLMRSGANSRQVAHDAEVTLKQVPLPEGVKIVPLYSRSFLVDATIRTVAKSLLEGAALVISVLLLLLGNFRASLIVALAIPISMLIAVRGMLIFGISGNLMSLGAIDFGLLVDGSVVLIENILSRSRDWRMNRISKSKEDFIFEASSEVIAPITFGLFMIMIVYLPILTLEGVEGKMFKPMALTVIMALFASLGVTIFVMPVLADLFLRLNVSSNPKHPESGHSEEKETPFFHFLKKLYVPLLQYSLNHPMRFIVPAIVIVFCGTLLLLRMGADFIPKLDEGDLVIGLTRNPKISLDRSVQEQTRAEKLLSQFPEVETVFSRLGTPESATDPMGVNLADTFVILKKDKSVWKHPSKEALFSDMKEKLSKMDPDQDLSATQPIEMRFNEILEGSRADVTVRVFGLDLQSLVKQIDSVKTVIENIEGVESISFDPLTSLRQSPMLDLVLNYEALAKYGVTISEINKLVELAMGGKEVGDYFEKGIRFPIVVHLDESLRNQLHAISSIPVGLPQGGTLPLSAFTQARLQDRVTTIARSWGERYAAISINLKNRDVASFVQDAQAQVKEKIQLPEGFRLYWGGQFKNLDRAKARLFVIVPVTLVFVFALLLRSLGSLSQTLVVFSSIPFGAVGGVFSLFARNIPLSVSAAVGFIALIGIALLNSLVLIGVLNQRKIGDEPLKQHVLEGAVSRLRPVMMTALVASLGFLPMALNTSLGSEVQRPLATVVIGGIITSTLLTLILLPTLYFKLKSREPVVN